MHGVSCNQNQNLGFGFYFCAFITCCARVAGFFMEPTIFTNVEDDNFIAKEESFGPVMIVSTFENG